ncbi:Phenol regulator MopR [Andreprevotia sp. IGB-42]|uniref:sigma 54-interacting transcriptional regulator n=1 Tax=Andreprevotia sp. IGB-42 TaxID=2497473 RepID=UPI001358BFC1|nr:sigma 54-interacting transcriptional regulator [Andreprevotia sp. IGB-42]KAF0815281.1 Phenol regulator MopR [Andreprevotia sp. IGB-42]
MDKFSQLNLIGSSHSFLQVLKQIQKIAKVDVSAFVMGETGTGKELAVRAIHYLGQRHEKPFVPVNCGALPETLIESELFGHERGAFTDAKAPYRGLIAEAEGGTLFLDEIDSLGPKAQSALLRFLQDGSYRRVGASVQRHADVRIIVASNVKMETLLESRTFRRDLLYRLNILTLHIPPLRQRGQDAAELAHVFLDRLRHQYRMPDKQLHPDAMQFIASHPWPGNVRELENMLHREFLMSDDEYVRLGPPQHGIPEVVPVAPGSGLPVALKVAKAEAIARFEQNYVRELLERANGNLTHAAQMAGQDRSAFGKLVRKHRLSHDKSS